jgi:DNA invertase Pin-like site-specific DNA recombinase
MIACYCRVSSRRQKTDGQKAARIRWLTGHGIQPSSIQWLEQYETGTTMRCLAFERMQRVIFDGTVATVVVWKLDRLSRRQHEGITMLADWCERGVRVGVVTQHSDLRGALGRTLASTSSGWQKSRWNIAKNVRQLGLPCLALDRLEAAAL